MLSLWVIRQSLHMDKIHNQTTISPVSLTWDPVSFWEIFIKDQRMTLTLVHVYLHVFI